MDHVLAHRVALQVAHSVPKLSLCYRGVKAVQFRSVHHLYDVLVEAMIVLRIFVCVIVVLCQDPSFFFQVRDQLAYLWVSSE